MYDPRTLRPVQVGIELDHSDLLVMDGLTQSEYEHSTARELLGRISQHIGALSTSRLKWWCSTFRGARLGWATLQWFWVEEMEMSRHLLWSSWMQWEHAFTGSLRSLYLRKYVAVITIVCPLRSADFLQEFVRYGLVTQH